MSKFVKNMEVKESIKPGYKKTKLGWIPDDWKLMSINEITDRVTNSVTIEQEEEYREIGIRSHGKGIFHKKKVTGESLGNKRVFWIEPDCFVVNIVFAWEQAVAKTTESEVGMIASHRFPMYKPKEDVLDLDYLLYFFKTPLGKHLLGLASPGGAGRNKTLGQKDFGKLRIPIPSLKEQKNIIQILKTWNEAIVSTQNLTNAKKQQREGLLQMLLKGKLRLNESPTAAKFKKTAIGEIPVDWGEVKLGEIGEFKNGVNKSKEDFGFGSPFINLMDIFGKPVTTKKEFGKVNVSAKEVENYGLRKGDILFVRSSVKPSGVGLTTLIDEDLKSTVYSGFIIRFRETENVFFHGYKKYCFYESRFRNSLIIRSSVSANANINQDNLKILVLPVPPIGEQKKIAKTLSFFDQEINHLKEKLNFLKKQRKGLIQQLLIGKIRT